jgi:Domain of unknown function (DUF6438)
MAFIEAVKLTRGRCYGTCPAYQVTLRRDGSAVWEGEAFTDRLGLHRGSVDPEEFELLTSFISRSGFFDWQDDYPPSATDLPDYALTVTRSDMAKRVTVWAASPGPPDFHIIGRMVDGIADRIEWQ